MPLVLPSLNTSYVSIETLIGSSITKGFVRKKYKYTSISGIESQWIVHRVDIISFANINFIPITKEPRPVISLITR